jgi:type II secretory pathway pseudopilin PulG
MKRFYKWGILGGIAVLLLVGIGILALLAKAPKIKDAAYYQQRAKQDFYGLIKGIDDFKAKFGRVPASLEELSSKTDYLHGVTPTWQSNIFRRIDYPYKGDKAVGDVQVIARHRLSEKYRFILLQDGQILAEDPKMEHESDKSTNGLNP